MASSPTDIGAEYPESDGRPMAESDLHGDVMVEVIETLKGHFAGQPDVYVSGNLLIYYEPGNPRKCRAPDAFVVWGVARRERKIYKLWEEKAPGVVVEITSASTRDEDVADKMALYRDVWKVGEYFLFDPLEEYLDPSMQGFRLVEGEYRPIEPSGGQLFSERLKLFLMREGTQLAFGNPATGRRLLRPDAERARQAQLALQLAEAQAAHAERVTALATEEREQERAAREQAEAARDAERAARQQAEAQRDTERAAREQAEAEREALRREIEALRRQQPPSP